MTSSTLEHSQSQFLSESESWSTSTLPESARLVRDSSAHWLSEVVAELVAFLSLKPNWDSYEAIPVRIENVKTAIELLFNFSAASTPRPSVVPTNLGGVQIEWHQKAIDLEIEIHSPVAIDVCFEDLEKGVEREYELRSDLHILEDLVSKLSQQ